MMHACYSLLMTNRSREQLNDYMDQYVTIACESEDMTWIGEVIAIADLFRGGNVIVVLRLANGDTVGIHDHLIDAIVPLTFDEMEALGLDGTLRNT
jgi:hypothetical protein